MCGIIQPTDSFCDTAMASFQVLILSLGFILAVQGARIPAGPAMAPIAARILHTQNAVLPKHDSRIVGGYYASDGQFPYQAALFIESSKFCGGSLISDEWILTAGHCISGSRKFTVMMGSTSIYQDDVPGRVVMNAYEGIVHESYGRTEYLCDIGLVRLPSRVKFGATISAIKLPLFDGQPGQHATVSGWGAVHSDGVVSERLKFVPVTIISNADCAKQYSEIYSSKICASASAAGICTGDDGGALVVHDSQVGIASYVTHDCLSYASVFTRVTSFRDWITENSGI